MKDLSKEIKAYALKNALEFGKADPSRILPKLFQHGLEKSEIKEIIPKITATIKEINSLSTAEKEKQYTEYKKLVIIKEEKPHELPELPNVKGAVITRLPPEPSKYLHLGHALSFILNSIYAKRYNGKCLLRFEDANPEKVSQEYVDAILDDIDNYLEIKYESIKYVSEDMPLFYKYAEKIINSDNAYMCFCDREKMQKLRFEGKSCECHKNPIKKNKEEWEKFLEGKYMKGEAILRLKGDMKSKNYVMRDPVIFRAVAEKHFIHGNKYKIWPMYDFYNPIEDSIMGITHILRSNEFETRVELQDYIKDLLKLNKQTIIQYGRFTVIDTTTKGREIRDLIKSGEYIGWDDPRLVTLKALRRRGITKEALYELTNQMGLSKKQVNLDFDMIAAINRKIIDPIANRYSFVKDPVALKIKNRPNLKTIKVPIHPDKKETRTINVDTETIFISKEDFKKFKGKEIRLLHLYNIKLGNKDDSADFVSLENKDIPKINWVSKGVQCTILMPDCSLTTGLAEEAIERLKKGKLLQFERLGFARFDNKKKGVYETWFAHK
ncbi:MAG: glutamate--tRNA ligase [Nanoarchaeota archaeon]|nr:glutamate--tRNA ligase [Nanoarchaeota archaeon]